VNGALHSHAASEPNDCPGKYLYSPPQPAGSLSGGPTRVGSGHPCCCPHVWPCSGDPQVPSFISVKSPAARSVAAGGSSHRLPRAPPALAALPMASGGRTARRRCAAAPSPFSAAVNSYCPGREPAGFDR
jgi:hypothetical protein